MDDTLLQIIYIVDFIPQHLLVHFEAEPSKRSGKPFWKADTFATQTGAIKWSRGQLSPSWPSDLLSHKGEVVNACSD